MLDVVLFRVRRTVQYLQRSRRRVTTMVLPAATDKTNPTLLRSFLRDLILLIFLGCTNRAPRIPPGVLDKAIGCAALVKAGTDTYVYEHRRDNGHDHEHDHKHEHDHAREHGREREHEHEHGRAHERERTRMEARARACGRVWEGVDAITRTKTTRKRA